MKPLGSQFPPPTGGNDQTETKKVIEGAVVIGDKKDVPVIVSEEALKKPSIRFSFSKYNTKSEIDEVIGVLKDLVLEPA